MEHVDGFGKVSEAQAVVIAVGVLIAKCLACGCTTCAITITGALNNAGPVFKKLPPDERE